MHGVAVDLTHAADFLISLLDAGLREPRCKTRIYVHGSKRIMNRVILQAIQVQYAEQYSYIGLHAPPPNLV